MKAFEATKLFFNIAADHVDLDERMRRLLLTAKREVQVQIPIELDNGNIETLIGYRVQHDNARGPMKGGLRYHRDVDLDEVRALAALMWVVNSLSTANLFCGSRRSIKTMTIRPPKALKRS